MENERICARFRFAVYENSDRSWCVYKYRDTEMGKEFKAVGTELPAVKDLKCYLYGRWEKNAKDGSKQFRVSCSEDAEPAEKGELTAYLSSLRCGFAKVKAARIWDRFGEDSWDIISNSPERLKEISGISDRQIDKLKLRIRESRALRELVKMFSDCGMPVSGDTAARLVNALGNRAAELMGCNPYVAYTAGGLSFEDADGLAKALGFPADHPTRLSAGVLKTLEDSLQAGSSCMRIRDALSAVSKTLSCGEDTARTAVNTAVRNGGAVYVSAGYLYRKRSLEWEKTIAEEIRRTVCEGAAPEPNADLFLEGTGNTGTILAEGQKDAVRAALAYPVSIITGGPGTGKTTVIKELLRIHSCIHGPGSRPVLLAPTGRAAGRMTEATGVKARTIHSAVGWCGDDRDSVSDEDLDGNLFIVDEASMMDQHIAAMLLEKIPSGSRLVFLGDPNQLPSVGSGNVLADMIDSGSIPVTRLQVIFRQTETNPIVANLAEIVEGSSNLTYAPSFRFIETGSEEETFRAACAVYLRSVKACGIENVILLNPQRHNCGLCVDNFNRILQNAVNPPKEDAPEIRAGGICFRAGDRIMQMKNTERARNGDIGVIRGIAQRSDPDGETYFAATVEFSGTEGELEYTAEDLRHCDLAYCTTVHKSQGSEYRTVIQVVSPSHRKLNRRTVIYTGISRAREYCCLIGSRQTLAEAIKDGSVSEERVTLLKERLRKISE